MVIDYLKIINRCECSSSGYSCPSDYFWRSSQSVNLLKLIYLS